MAPAKRDTMCW